MEKKQLYMIGNSHIDPVWFWNWEEGMQEVKATYASALDRMREYKDFKFTSTSTAFFQWIEELVPDMFEEIKQRVAEGRWEITGGWFIEPDCILPCGEAFVRQGLYSQRYLKEKFGQTCHIGSNVDSFGHNHMLPQILKKSGMDSYVFMRPRLDTPVFKWVGEDGSSINAISLPAEYTTWFHEPTKKNIELTLERTQGWNKMPCCYGVGNHGGGPTKENIESIISLNKNYKDVELVFSHFDTYLKDIKEEELVELSGPFENVNEGCYSVDSEFKRLNRLAERRLIEADILSSMATGLGNSLDNRIKEIKELWQLLLFNHFHDTMGGTAIKAARDEAIMQLSTVCAKAGIIKAIAIQNMVNRNDTRGEGFPLFLFNTSGQSFEDYVTVELEWFCKSPLTLLNAEGKEIPYQRIHTDAKVRHTNLGGRRKFVFFAKIPPMGYVEYRTLVAQSTMVYNNELELDEENLLLENTHIRVAFDKKTGMLASLVEKATNTEILSKPCSFRIWTDERDTWGGDQGRTFEDTKDYFALESIEKVESGKLKQTIRTVYKYGENRMEQLYYLYQDSKEVFVENRLRWIKPWSLLKMAYPVGIDKNNTKAETSYGILKRKIEDTSEYYMHRFLDVSNDAGAGLAIANDSKYAFNLEEGRAQITVARSAIYAQGNSVNWYNEKESYQYTDLGEQVFTVALRPHSQTLENQELMALAKKINGGYEYLADSAHLGKDKRKEFSFASTDKKNVEVMLVKKAEEDDDYIIRLLELDGKDSEFTLNLLSEQYKLTIGHYEIKTVKINNQTKVWKEVNLLEWEE